MRIRHVVNVVGASARRDLLDTQALTLETIDIARRLAPEHIEIEVVGVRFADEEQPADWLIDDWQLERSVLDVGTFQRQRRLPLLRDVLAPFDGDDYDLGIYTNIDIALQPRFYELIAEIHRAGHDAFVINRRTVQSSNPDKINSAWLTHQVGAPHPGHDCFVFTPSVFAGADVDDACLGAPYVMRAFLYHMVLTATRFRDFTDLHATFHLGDDREWTTTVFEDYHAHNAAALRRSVSRMIDRHGRESVLALPEGPAHVRAIEGKHVPQRRWTTRYDRPRRPHTFGQRRLIFAASPGRCGSNFLAHLLDTGKAISADHEPDPAMIGEHLRDIAYGSASESFQRRLVKADALRARLAETPRGAAYAETTHMFVKTFADVVLDQFNHDQISVVHLHRPIASVVGSMAALGWFTPLTSFWSDWLIPPTAPGALFRIAPEQVESHLDMAIGYVLDTELRTRNLRRATPGVNWVDADVSTLDRERRLDDLFDALNVAPTEATRGQVALRVNDRAQRKRHVGAARPAEEIDDAIASFRLRFADMIDGEDLTDMFEPINDPKDLAPHP